MVIKIKTNKYLLSISLSWKSSHKYNAEADTDVSENHEMYHVPGNKFKLEDGITI